MFGKFGQTPARSVGNYIHAGTYIVEVVEFVAKEGQNTTTKGHELFIGQFTILDVITAYEATADGAYKASNRRGERVSYIRDTSKPSSGEAAMADVKNLMLAIGRLENPELSEADISPEEWNEALAEAVAPPGHKCRGIRLVMHAIRKPTRAGNPFVAVSFEPYAPPDATVAP